ncbi:MAG: 5'/3'-nucleotidase SurE [Pseudomonadota bacterium]
MRILITNDDGITAPGLEVMEGIATELAGPDGEVVTVAPAFEQSGVGHCISYVRPMRLEQMGPNRFAVEGSPADCVMAGLFEVMKDTPPDLILSGVNKGHNVAEDTLYSGTLGAAMEGALHKMRAVGMSQYYSPELYQKGDIFNAAKAHGARVMRRLLETAPWEQDGRYGVFYNINFPPVWGDEVKGIRVTRQGERGGSPFSVEAQVAPNMRKYLWVSHGRGNPTSAPGTDAREASEGYITVTPLRADLTAGDLVQTLSQPLDEG